MKTLIIVIVLMAQVLIGLTLIHLGKIATQTAQNRTAQIEALK
jgi:preprotein translocase subunit SecG